jgi:lysophospholipase L1-like esterase
MTAKVAAHRLRILRDRARQLRVVQSRRKDESKSNEVLGCIAPISQSGLMHMDQVRLFVLSGLLAVSSFAARATAVPLRIMAIGDSITHGVDGGSPTLDATKGGYRTFLAQKLNDANIDHVWLGEYSDGPPIARYHEGWNGETIREIDTERVDPAFNYVSGSLPDVVLLMIGINDAVHPEWGDEYTTRENMLPNLHALIYHIFHRAPEARIVISTITPLSFQNQVIDDARDAYNNGMPDLVNELQGDGINIGLVNAGGRVPRNLILDGVHPGDAGYRLIADGFYEAFMLPQTPEPTLVLPMTAIAFFLRRLSRRSIRGAV